MWDLLGNSAQVRAANISFVSCTVHFWDGLSGEDFDKVQVTWEKPTV
jgi:hypothetical protein